MEFYHYSSKQRLCDITQSFQQNGSECFRPRRRFIPLSAAPDDISSKASEPAIFGLLDPLDDKWCRACYHKDEPLLETILIDISDHNLCLLKITITEAEDIYIADHSPHLDERYNGWRSRDRKIVHEVKRVYWKSLIPLREYLAQELSHTLPEVICFSAIPLTQIRLVSTEDKKNIVNNIRRKGGLAPHP